MCHKIILKKQPNTIESIIALLDYGVDFQDIASAITIQSIRGLAEAHWSAKNCSYESIFL
jgi:hypothetical protein